MVKKVFHSIAFCIIDEDKTELAKYAKNYLPILFNLYSGEEKEKELDKLPILETIRTYLTITDSQVRNNRHNLSWYQWKICVLICSKSTI